MERMAEGLINICLYQLFIFWVLVCYLHMNVVHRQNPSIPGYQPYSQISEIQKETLVWADYIVKKWMYTLESLFIAPYIKVNLKHEGYACICFIVGLYFQRWN